MHGKKIRMKRMGACVLSLALALSLAGCSREAEGDDKVILIEKEEESIVYNLAAVTRGDVVKTERIKCVYAQMQDQSVSFAINGRLVTKVYVKEGDQVTKGQILAELGNTDLVDRIENLEYNIARNEMLLAHAEVNEPNDLSAAWSKSVNMGWASQAQVEKEVENIARNYRYNRENIEDSIELDEKELANLRRELKLSAVYADMDGTVTFVKERLEGSTSTKDEEIMEIIDGTDCLFTVDGTDYADKFKEGDTLDMNVISGTGTGAYVLKPHNMNEWNEKLYFTILQQPEGVSPEVGAIGYMGIVIDAREDVLTLPLTAIHKADDKQYVYVLGEDGMRQLQWIETGLYGDSSVEIVSGLSEGDKVIQP
ncbi:MAG: biotin/lipoyl-binding protein [Lachnospiraceae bacterium]|nr:biotin/lipoyl-binding protein [Lachnospiraceae bacterium]